MLAALALDHAAVVLIAVLLPIGGCTRARARADPGRRQGAAAVARAARERRAARARSAGQRRRNPLLPGVPAIRHRPCSSRRASHACARRIDARGCHRLLSGREHRRAVARASAPQSRIAGEAGLRAGSAARAGDDHARLRAAGHRTASRGIRSARRAAHGRRMAAAVRRRRARGICGWARSDRVTPPWSRSAASPTSRR